MSWIESNLEHVIALKLLERVCCPFEFHNARIINLCSYARGDSHLKKNYSSSLISFIYDKHMHTFILIIHHSLYYPLPPLYNFFYLFFFFMVTVTLTISSPYFTYSFIWLIFLICIFFYSFHQSYQPNHQHAISKPICHSLIHSFKV